MPRSSLDVDAGRLTSPPLADGCYETLWNHPVATPAPARPQPALGITQALGRLGVGGQE